MRYVVKVKCFYDGRLYEVGDAAEFDSAADLPPYFEPLEPIKQETEAKVEPEPEHEEVKPEPEKPKGRGGRPKKKNG